MKKQNMYYNLPLHKQTHPKYNLVKRKGLFEIPVAEIPLSEIPDGVELNRQEVLDSWNNRVNLDPHGNPEDTSLAYETFDVKENIRLLLSKIFNKLKEWDS